MKALDSRIWVSILYFGLALVPLVVAVAPPRPPGRAFWIELSMAVGFIALSQLALQFALIARFERISSPFGIDLIMQYHRQIGILTMFLVLAHPIVLLAVRPAYASMLNPFGGTLASRTGVWSIVALLLLVAFSLWRRQLRIGYELWRVTHAVLAIATLGLAQLHVSLAGIYVNAPWKNRVLILWCLIFVSLILYLRMIKPILLARRPWTIAEIRPEAAATWSVRLEPEGHGGLRFAPGQFAWLKVGSSPWNLAEHPFSFSSSAEQHGSLEFGIKELGDFTNGIGKVSIGTRAFLDGPHGSFSIDHHPANGYVFIAGGIGVSPILSMLRTLADRRDRGSHTLVYACSRWDRIAFREEVEMLAAKLDLQIVYVLEEPHEGWSGPTGFITREVLETVVGRGFDGHKRPVFICGPDPMMSAVERSLSELGIPQQQIHMERFNLV
ncbi:MAG TPA: ferric reductase-like transmembrane domain-containing protein [Thermoanaerobaculia bacterium]|nr:ferric reductase-like transmembrane domain-containing protein [Thermoanaerobaculia bacterium]